MKDQGIEIDLALEEDNFFEFLDYLKEEDIVYIFGNTEIVNDLYIVKIISDDYGYVYISNWRNKKQGGSIDEYQAGRWSWG